MNSQFGFRFPETDNQDKFQMEPAGAQITMKWGGAEPDGQDLTEVIHWISCKV